MFPTDDAPERTPAAGTPAPADNPAADPAGDDFARLLAESEAAPATATPRPGDRITGTVVQVGDETVFVDYGGRSELPLSAAEVRDDEGNLTVAVGDTVTAWVTGRGDDLRLSLRGGGQRGDTGWIEEALASGVPVRGTVRETNKGGFVVDLGGHRAFCPISQIDDSFVAEPETWVGRELEFRILEFAEGGRRLVVSRRALLTEEKARRAAETRRTLREGDVVDGTVKRLMPYGAFVDIGGVEGLLHVSQISHAHVDDPADHLQEGQKVRVQVIEIQDLGGPRERISLSLKSLADDPWQAVPERLAVGDWTTGVVTGLADFGAFVELWPGVRGLVHVSELGEERVGHPRDVLREGQEVRVRVKEIDVPRRRISLSLVG